MGKLAQGTDNDPYGKDLLTTRIIRDGSKRHQVCVAPILTVFLDKKSELHCCHCHVYEMSKNT